MTRITALYRFAILVNSVHTFAADLVHPARVGELGQETNPNRSRRIEDVAHPTLRKNGQEIREGDYYGSWSYGHNRVGKKYNNKGKKNQPQVKKKTKKLPKEKKKSKKKMKKTLQHKKMKTTSQHKKMNTSMVRA